MAELGKARKRSRSDGGASAAVGQQYVPELNKLSMRPAPSRAPSEGAASLAAGSVAAGSVATGSEFGVSGARDGEASTTLTGAASRSATPMPDEAELASSAAHSAVHNTALLEAYKSRASHVAPDGLFMYVRGADASAPLERRALVAGQNEVWEDNLGVYVSYHGARMVCAYEPYLLEGALVPLLRPGGDCPWWPQGKESADVDFVRWDGAHGYFIVPSGKGAAGRAGPLQAMRRACDDCLARLFLGETDYCRPAMYFDSASKRHHCGTCMDPDMAPARGGLSLAARIEADAAKEAGKVAAAPEAPWLMPSTPPGVVCEQGEPVSGYVYVRPALLCPLRPLRPSARNKYRTHTHSEVGQGESWL
jgi:hypothetical protein